MQSSLSNPQRAPGRIRYFGDYELLEEIARGGMGVVYKARQASLNRMVAVKMILSGEFASEQFVRRFRKEAEAAANLVHPNIVAIHEVGEHEGQHYFSMDYVEGKNLAELVRDGPLPARQAAAYLQAIAEAIHYAHKRGTLHRDLKPSNIIIDAFDKPRLTDFGLAKQLNGHTELTTAGQILGSPSFTPPEQAAGRNHEIEPRSDVYGLGAILYHLLTGRPPFVAATIHETLALVAHFEPVALRALNPGVPRDLETICLKCLQKKRERRYASASDLAEDLGRFLRGEPIRARPVSVAERALHWCRREPALAQLVATAVVCFFALIVGLALHAASVNRERRKAEYASVLLAQILSAIDNPVVNRLFPKNSVTIWDAGAGWILGNERLSPDGTAKLVFSIVNSNALAVCDARTGAPVCKPLVHPSEVTSFTFSPDGTSILTVCANANWAPGAAYLWEAATGKLIATLHGSPVANALVHSVEFSPDGRFLATRTEGGQARIWDVSNGQALLLNSSNPPSLHPGVRHMARSPVVSARFSPDGRFIFTVTKDFGVQVWDARTGKPWKLPF